MRLMFRYLHRRCRVQSRFLMILIFTANNNGVDQATSDPGNRPVFSTLAPTLSRMRRFHKTRCKLSVHFLFRVRRCVSSTIQLYTLLQTGDPFGTVFLGFSRRKLATILRLQLFVMIEIPGITTWRSRQPFPRFCASLSLIQITLFRISGNGFIVQDIVRPDQQMS